MKSLAFILFLLSAGNLLGAEEEIMPPMPASPVPEFRNWLKMTAEQRTVALQKRSPKSREALEAKLKEYESLPDEDRERRLCAVEVHWYLRSLTEMSRTNRELAVAKVPNRLRPVVKARLAQWEELEKNVGPERKKQILENEKLFLYVSSPMAKERSTQDERGIQDHLRQFFKMPAQAQEKAINQFGPGERDKMIATLQAFRNLPEQQRAASLKSFSQFASMNEEEQRSFLRNVDRWQSMTKEDREAWRLMINEMPPMPPLPEELMQPPFPQ